jgi:LPXTG-motif cell wall-anchored protein
MVCALLLAGAPAAHAHEGNPDYRSVIRSVDPSVPDVTFEVLDYDSHLQLLDREGHEVVVYGYEGEPYARILRDGTVQVNQRSPAAYLNEDRFAEATVPPSADPHAPPRWKAVDDSGTFTWHDHRMHYMASGLPPKVTDEGRKTKIFDYEIPVRIDGRPGTVEGTLYWVGRADTSKLPFVVVGLVVLLGGGALVLVVRRRRDGGGPAAGSPPAEAW